MLIYMNTIRAQKELSREWIHNKIFQLAEPQAAYNPQSTDVVKVWVKGGGMWHKMFELSVFRAILDGGNSCETGKDLIVTGECQV